MTRFCACAATWFLFWRTVFQDWRLVRKSSSIDPETPEKAIISVFESYLVHLGSFKRHILYFCASIVEKIRSHWGEPYEAKFVVVSVPTNGSNVAFNVVIWRKVLQSTTYLWRIFLRCWKGFPRYSRWLLMGRIGEWSWSATWLPIVCNNLIYPLHGIRRRKPSNLLLCRKSYEVWGNNGSNMKRFHRHSIHQWLRSVVVKQKVLTTGHAMFNGNIPCIFSVWA